MVVVLVWLFCGVIVVGRVFVCVVGVLCGFFVKMGCGLFDELVWLCVVMVEGMNLFDECCVEWYVNVCWCYLLWLCVLLLFFVRCYVIVLSMLIVIISVFYSM